MKSEKKYYFFAFLAAALYALSAPISKLLLQNISPIMVASLVYLGAGIGMGIIGLVRKKIGKTEEKPLTKKELPFTIGMILLDILAPILLLLGLSLTTAENASLLNNFEIVATSLLAIWFFQEKIGKKLWVGIVFITVASIILSFENIEALRFSAGSALILVATLCWGLENNFTRKMSSKDPLQIVVIKGLFSGMGSLVIAIVLNQATFDTPIILAALLLGFVAYGLSIFFYVHSQRTLGAAKTSAFYAVAPFIGVLFSFLIFQEIPGYPFFIALGVMILGTYFASLPQNNSHLEPLPTASNKK